MTDSGPLFVAAVDLGSNSFHMVLAQLVDGEPVIVDRLRDQVQLALGLDDDRNLTGTAKRRALASLERFGQRLRGVHPGRVRAVGTNALRAARNAAGFLREAEAALGHTIEVISGREEARLIYLGVAHTLADDIGPRLVLDIGGGSTECILGERFEALEVHSLHMGCISYSQRFFKHGLITARAMEKAQLAASREILSLLQSFLERGWSEAVGASGTIRSAAAVMREAGWADGSITADGLAGLRSALLEAGRCEALDLPGLKADRAAVFPGGVAILLALFESFGLQRMHVGPGALREGVLYDLLGRIRHEDVRERTIRLFQERYRADGGQAGRVERVALNALQQVRAAWRLDHEECHQFLAWSARLHEIGLAISYSQHQKHGAYLIANSDLSGFSRDDQAVLSVLVRGHRRRPPANLLTAVIGRRRRVMVGRLLVLLRLAVLFNRGRQPLEPPSMQLTARKNQVTLGLPGTWLDEHPLTRADLADEVRALRVLDFALDVQST